jgi:LPXTG-motif cell wall-anchored protein
VITLPVFITPSAAVGTTAVPTPTHAAPGPLVGAGLPVLVIAGGAYWVVRRRRRKRS